MEKVYLTENERVDDLQISLGNERSLCVIQNPDFFCFGVDAVLLANFAKVKKGSTVADLGCGCGVIPLIMAAKTSAAHITGVELQADVAEMAQRSVALNGLCDKVSIVNTDLKSFGNPSAYDVVTCNPPYKEDGGGLKNPDSHLAIARHEICCTLKDVIAAAARIVKPGGSFAMVHRPERLTDIICFAREKGLEVKRLRFIHPAPGKTANIILVEAIRGGRPKLFLEPPLYIYNEAGCYSAELEEIYGRIR